MNKTALEAIAKKVDAFVAVERPTKTELDAVLPEWKRLVQEMAPTMVEIALADKMAESADYCKVWFQLVNYYPKDFFPPGRIVEAPPGYDKLQ